jgi:hypothetical protein
LVRLHAVVEGQTEETFVNRVLAPSLGARHIFIDAHRITTGRKRKRLHRGGISHYAQLKRDLVLWMKQDLETSARFTTMIDLYQLPRDFPGYDECRKNVDPFERVRCLEDKLRVDIGERRFIPYIQLHEFEALLFSEVSAFESAFPDQPELIKRLAETGDGFPSPEHIDEKPDQSPSARIMRLVPDYVKPVAGILIVQKIGLTTLRDKCEHFGEWMNRLEQLISD